MTDKAMSPLRRRMIEDMTIRKFAPKTQASYVRAVKNFTIFLGRSPDTASCGGRAALSAASGRQRRRRSDQNATVTALRFFFTVTLGRAEVTSACLSFASPASCRWF